MGPLIFEQLLISGWGVWVMLYTVATLAQECAIDFFSHLIPQPETDHLHLSYERPTLDTFVIKPSGGRLVPTHFPLSVEHCTQVTC